MYTNSQKKRKRNKNWQEVEKTLLKRCIMENFQVVENKNSDTNTLYAKRQAWKSILMKFNTLNDHQRDLCQLQVQWKSMKLAVKSRYRRESTREAMATCGGPKPPSPSEEDSLVDMLPNEFSVDENLFDSDAIFKSKMEYTHTPRFKGSSEKQLPFTTSMKLSNEVVQDISHSEADDTPTIPPVTFRPSPRNTCKKKAKSIDEKLKMMLFEETKKLLYREHEKRLQCMEEETRAKIRIFEGESRAKIRIMEEEHTFKLSLLKS